MITMKSHPMTRSAFASLGFLVILTISQAMSLVENFQLDPKKVEEIQNELLLRVITPEDGELRREVKVILVKYLVETTLTDYMKQIRGSRQDDGDGEGGAEAAQDPDQVYNGVRRLLQNVFSGNLIGVIQEGVSIRSPGRVQEFFSDVMGALFGSAAVKGAGTIGVAILNATASPLNATELPPGAIAQQQQYNPALVGLDGVALPQQQQIAGVAAVPAVAPLRGNSRPISYQRPGAIAAVNNVNTVPAAAAQESDNEDDENDDFYK